MTARGKMKATHEQLVTAVEKAITNLLPTIVQAISGSVVEIMQKKMEAIYTNKTGDCLFVCWFVCLSVRLWTAKPQGLTG